MSSYTISVRTLLLLAGAFVPFSESAATVSLRTSIAQIYQIGSTAGVNLGHTVIASTLYNRLYAHGSYSAQCAHPDMLPTTGARGFGTDNFGGGLQLYVTVPEWHPATVLMPGFSSLPRGTYVNCTYNWTSRAVEGGYSIGVSGISFQTGSAEANAAGTRDFGMHVPGLSDPTENSACIP